MNRVLVLMTLFAGTLFACGDPAREDPDVTNRLCSQGTCPPGYVCGTGTENRGQCVRGCATRGPGGVCPAGTFCYVPPETGEPGYCTLICSADAACQARHPSLVCKERTQTEPWALKICLLK